MSLELIKSLVGKDFFDKMEKIIESFHKRITALEERINKNTVDINIILEIVILLAEKEDIDIEHTRPFIALISDNEKKAKKSNAKGSNKAKKSDNSGN